MILCLLLAVALPAPGKAESPPEGAAANGKFTRFVEDDSGCRLQTGVGSYRNKEGVTVDLIGAIHIADRAYYEKLNRRFERYDAMLYEMVGESYAKRMKAAKTAPEEVTPREKVEEREESRARDNFAWLHPLYETMEKSLGLTGQMSAIDYGAGNFVHADMTAREFAAMQRKKSESFLTLWWKSVMVQVAHPDAAPEQPGLLKILESLCRQEGSVGLRRAAARTFGSIEGMLSGIEGEDGSVILAERNKVALEVLAEQIKLGKRNLAIFYGAAHLADMEKRLLAMGFERTGGEWFHAWDMPPEPKTPVRR